MTRNAGACCYVYYRVERAQLLEACGAIARLMADVRKRTGIDGSLSRRVDGVRNAGSQQDSAITLMETYAGIADPAAFERQLDEATQCGASGLWLADGSARTVEWFMPLDCPGNPD